MLAFRGGFLSADERQVLMALARDGLAEHRLARRANAIILLDKGYPFFKNLVLIHDWQKSLSKSVGLPFALRRASAERQRAILDGRGEQRS